MSAADNVEGVEICKVSRTFRLKDGSVRHAVRDITLNVSPGEIVTVLGPNGAGKTTLVKMITGLLRPTSGTIRIDGFDTVRSRQLSAGRCGFALGGDTGLYPRISATDNLVFFGMMYGLTRARSEVAARDALQLVGLDTRASDLVEKFSRGMKQRVHLARTLLHSPSVLILDEPSAGLDPDSAESMRRLVEHLAAEGKAILLTTHDMREAEELGKRVLVMKDGEVILEADPATMRRRAAARLGRTIKIRVRHPDTLGTLGTVPGAATIAATSPFEAEIRTEEVAEAIAWLVQELGPQLDDLIVGHPTLEEVFLDAVRS